jgi:RNA polymerase sigma-70 factor (ECF subfamily)
LHDTDLLGIRGQRLLTTSVSLLQRLRRGANPHDWQRFVHLYTPLLFRWARRAGAQDADAADLVQEVLTLLVHKLPTFEYDSSRSFRAWLRTVLRNKWRDTCRYRAARPDWTGSCGVAEMLTRDEESEEREDLQQLVSRALEIIRADFQPHTWQAFWEFVSSGREAAAVAADLGVRVEVIYSAKCRVLRRLRQELAGLLD